MASFSLWISLVFCLTSSVYGDADWGYGIDDGPSKWYQTHSVCGANSQSPINIYEGDIGDPVISTKFSFSNYDNSNAVKMKMKNVGHGAKIELTGTFPEITGGGLTGTYRAVQFHLHWSDKDTEGSEHHISSQGFPGELHVVHYNTKYPNINAAVNQSDGLAVLGFMLEISPTPNPNYDNMVALVKDIVLPDSKVELAKQTLNSYLPNSFNDFYRYTGSLTTPPCFQSVTWTVFKETIKISRDQLEAFFEIDDHDNKPVLHNARPVMPINGRQVHANFKPDIHWTYHHSHYDAEHWADFYESCGKKSQSPVNIPSSPAKLENSLGNFTFNKFDETTGIDMTIQNNGHTVKVSLGGNGILPSIQDGGLPAEYEVAQFHFHWGSNNMRGSEHTIDAKSYPMEVHIVTWNKKMGSIGDALKKKDGLAVLGFFFEISPTDNPNMNPIINELSSILNPDPSNPKTMTTISLNSFIPADRSKFYRYSGSLTTPGCFESVVWTVFDSKIKISEAQMVKFRALISDHKEEGAAEYANIVDNYRPVQFLNSRQILRNFAVPAKAKVDWTYFGNTGTEYWKDLVKICGSNLRQSPIDIMPKTVEMVNFDSFKYKNFDTTTGVVTKIQNNGHTVVVHYKSGDLQVSGGGLPDPAYKVAQYHLHWGSVNTQGSEHTVDGASYPMELHIVTMNMLYSEFGVAMTQGNGLAVLGFMFQIPDDDQDNPDLEPLIAGLSKVTQPGGEMDLDTFALDSILPKDKSQFYRYDGSLTTPTCDESVTWTVFHVPIPISSRQMNKFRQLKSIEMDDKNNIMPMVDNYRPPQPIGERTVYSNFLISAGNSHMQTASTTSLLSILTYFLSFWGH